MSPRDAFYNTVHNAPGGHAALAVRLNMSAAVLRNKANVLSTTNKPTLDDVDNIIGLTGDAGVLHALAANHGYVCVKVEDGVSASDMAVLEIVTQIWTCQGDVGAEVNRALADGRLDPREMAAIKEAVYRTSQAMQQMVVRLEHLGGAATPEAANG